MRRVRNSLSDRSKFVSFHKDEEGPIILSHVTSWRRTDGRRRRLPAAGAALLRAFFHTVLSCALLP